MIERFTGPSGAANLLAAMLQQRLVQNDETIANKLIATGTPMDHQPGDAIITQGASDEFVFFILAGEAGIEVNGRLVGKRVPTETVGEMTAVDPTAPRSATVRALTVTVTLRVACADFVKVAHECPRMWHASARVLGERLRQRHRFHRQPNGKPVLFLGSSVEGLSFARLIQLGMKHEHVEARIWTDGLFSPSGVTIDKLMEQVDASDFAAFVFGPDDKVASRDATHYAPRDNVVFEMGLFLARLGRERTYIVKDQKSDIKIPSDLLGITPITYVGEVKANQQTVAGPVCTEIMDQIKQRGPF